MGNKLQLSSFAGRWCIRNVVAVVSSHVPRRSAFPLPKSCGTNSTMRTRKLVAVSPSLRNSGYVYTGIKAKYFFPPFNNTANFCRHVFRKRQPVCVMLYERVFCMFLCIRSLQIVFDLAQSVYFLRSKSATKLNVIIVYVSIYIPVLFCRNVNRLTRTMVVCTDKRKISFLPNN